MYYLHRGYGEALISHIFLPGWAETHKPERFLWDLIGRGRGEAAETSVGPSELELMLHIINGLK